jgi:hypothetical protein
VSDGFAGQVPGGEQPRAESKGEAQVRLASWICNVLRGWPLKVTVYDFEEESLAKFLGAINRRWPVVGKWGAPKDASGRSIPPT